MTHEPKKYIKEALSAFTQYLYVICYQFVILNHTIRPCAQLIHTKAIRLDQTSKEGLQLSSGLVCLSANLKKAHGLY